ncbi:hypothetical protein HDU85_006229 [Gaertneriomyces sp. JEL0708]|nr:hypothetical protein HDU85_006229 [Gaertneriomyces sp. JEL0708]
MSTKGRVHYDEIEQERRRKAEEERKKKELKDALKSVDTGLSLKMPVRASSTTQRSSLHPKDRTKKKPESESSGPTTKTRPGAVTSISKSSALSSSKSLKYSPSSTSSSSSVKRSGYKSSFMELMKEAEKVSAEGLVVKQKNGTPSATAAESVRSDRTKASARPATSSSRDATSGSTKRDGTSRHSSQRQQKALGERDKSRETAVNKSIPSTGKQSKIDRIAEGRDGARLSQAPRRGPVDAPVSNSEVRGGGRERAAGASASNKKRPRSISPSSRPVSKRRSASPAQTKRSRSPSPRRLPVNPYLNPYLDPPSAPSRSNMSDYIWSLMGRKRDRYDYDDSDLSDMEVNNARDIRREEARSARIAKAEDEREEREEMERERRRRERMKLREHEGKEGKKKKVEK